MQGFSTLLGGYNKIYYFFIKKTTGVSPLFFPIQFLNNANVTTATTVGKGDVLYTLSALLLPPPPGDGSIMDVLKNNGGFTKLVAYITKTPEVEAALSSVDGKTFFTFFAPGECMGPGEGGRGCRYVCICVLGLVGYVLIYIGSY